MKHYIATLVILLLITGSYLGIVHAQEKAALRKPPQNLLNLPDQIGQYKQRGYTSEVSDRVKKVLQTSLILKRDYIAPNRRPVYLSIVYAGTTRRSLHFPEVCLVGQGWRVQEQTTMPIGFMFKAKKLIIANNEHKEAMLYWFKTGDKLTGNFFENSLHWAMNQITFKQKASAMIKVSTPIFNDDAESAFSTLVDFSEKLTPELFEYIK